MSEKSMRSRVVRSLKALDAIAVENPALPGTPDVNYVEGWIELKQLTAWPQKADTVVRCDIFTPQQRVWHIRRRLAGGTSWLLLQVGREWLLFDGAVAALNLGLCTRIELRCLAVESNPSPSEKELVRWISRPQNAFSFGDVEKARLKQMQQSTSVSHLADTFCGKPREDPGPL